MNHYQVIRRPILTEKTNYQADELNRYTFQVDRRATKQMVRQAVEGIFDVAGGGRQYHQHAWQDATCRASRDAHAGVEKGDRHAGAGR